MAGGSMRCSRSCGRGPPRRRLSSPLPLATFHSARIGWRDRRVPLACSARPGTLDGRQVFRTRRETRRQALRGPQPMQDKLRHPWLGYPWAIAVALVLSLACLAAAPQDANAQDAGAFIQNLGTQGIQALGPSVPAAQRTARFRQLFDADFDGQGIARFVMGPHGRSMTPEQQQEFATLFRDYVAQTYSDKLATYGGAPFRVTGTRPNGEETIVTSEVSRHGGNPVQLVW